jgi:hypothetical protein
MKKIHVFAVALMLGAAAVLGVLAATRTVGLGSARAGSPQVTNASVTARKHRLDRVEAALKRALRDRPPALPSVPAVARRAAGRGSAPHIVYQRPAPIVVVKHNPHHDDGREHESEGGAESD